MSDQNDQTQALPETMRAAAAIATVATVLVETASRNGVKTNTPRIRGRAVELADGLVYVLPPMRLSDFVERKDDLIKIGGSNLGPGGGDEAVALLRTLGELAALSLERNYPDLNDTAKVLRLIDFGCLDDVMQAMVAQNGLVRPGEAPATTGGRS